ncbi:PaaI family thioesterase [Sporomusa sp.]|uniref:PaaI family thioesterase n=1 Tax=Sporomusa sp. TaxID=2078658 RepID=UPI002BAE9F80|nr:PaaI family thioesterase [Sporomusa sp.]HWR42947.1 PaaI family thioesterase [Sporomusa sp.]
MRILAEHANLLGVVHGGVRMFIAETAMKLACTSQGRLTTTTDMNISLFKSIEEEGILRAVASVIYHGRNSIKY